MLGDLLRTSATASPLNQPFSGDGAIIFRHTCALGYEGIVSKRLGSRWLKIKNPGTLQRSARRGRKCSTSAQQSG
jgi:ATP-dependent DNA ligase